MNIMDEQGYKNIIERLLKGWQPNYHLGNLSKEWHHPYKPFNNIEEMTEDEFAVILEIDNKLIVEGLQRPEGS